MNNLSREVGYDIVGEDVVSKGNPNKTVMASSISQSDAEIQAKAEQLSNGDITMSEGIAFMDPRHGPSQVSPSPSLTQTLPQTVVKAPDSDRMNIYVYPTDLGMNPELQNYMQFEMFETGGDSLRSQTSSMSDKLMIPKTIAGVNIEEYRTAVNNHNQITAAAVAGGAGIIGARVAGGTKWLSSAVGKGSTIAGLGKTLAGAATAAIGVNAAIQSGAAASLGNSIIENFGAPTDGLGMEDYSFERETTGLGTANKRISKTILLYLPSNLKTSYGVEYTEENFDTMVETLGSLKTIGRSLANLVGQAPQDNNQAAMQAAFQETYARHALAKASKMLGGMIGAENLNLGEYYAAKSRRVANPFTVNLFKSVKRRSFEFSFRFTPRSLPEVAMVNNIIKYFRMYALPKRSEELAGRYLDYPAEFRIKFFHNGIENQFLPKIARCALKDVSLTFGDEQFTTFTPVENWGAAPTKIDMTLSFEELEIMTQNRIAQGY